MQLTAQHLIECEKLQRGESQGHYTVKVAMQDSICSLATHVPRKSVEGGTWGQSCTSWVLSPSIRRPEDPPAHTAKLC